MSCIELGRQVRLLALAPSANAKFAHLLLLWAAEHGQKSNEEVRLPLSMTQEELAEAIGASRETVNRILSGLRRRGLIRIERGAILLRRLQELRALASF